jgi:hypothetical protein
MPWASVADSNRDVGKTASYDAGPAKGSFWLRISGDCILDVIVEERLRMHFLLSLSTDSASQVGSR